MSGNRRESTGNKMRWRDMVDEDEEEIEENMSENARPEYQRQGT